MTQRPDLKVVVDNAEHKSPVSPPGDPARNDLLQTLLAFAISLPLWGLIGWIMWMWWTGRV
jgi:hypothetical protein